MVQYPNSEPKYVVMSPKLTGVKYSFKIVCQLLNEAVAQTFQRFCGDPHQKIDFPLSSVFTIW